MSTSPDPRIRNILVSEQELLDDLQPAPHGLTVARWAPGEEVPFSQVDAVVLPYASSLRPYANLAEQLPGLKLVQTQSTGFDAALGLVPENVAIASAAGVHAAATAEMAVGLALASLRGIAKAAMDMQRGAWEQDTSWKSLADRKILLLGYGGIGREIYKRLEPFEVSITRVGHSHRTDKLGTVYGTDELEQLAPEHDVLIVIVPLDESTEHLVDAKLLAALPDRALVVNVARGAVVDSDALTSEVLSGRLFAALDVFDPEPVPSDHPIWTAKNALITPHIGGSSTAFFPRIRKFMKAQLEQFAADGQPLNLVRGGETYQQ